MKIELAKTENIHFIGIGGIGMSGLALIMKGMGFKIQGSDISKNKNIESLNYFNSSKELKEFHQSYIKNYLFSLILTGRVNQAINEVKILFCKLFISYQNFFLFF